MENINTNGTRPPPREPTRPSIHPSQGYGHSYSQEMRSLVVHNHINGESRSPLIRDLRQVGVYPSQASEYRWLKRLCNNGHLLPYRRTGNKRAAVFTDFDLVLLSIYRTLFPKAQQAEINAYLYRVNYGNPNFRFYAPSQITRAEDSLSLTRKQGSTTAYQAFLPINLLKRWMFWNLPYPFGIADIRRRDMIDFDECGFEESTADRTYGKAVLGQRVKQSGPYSKTGKLNLMLGISGDTDGARWLGGDNINEDG